MIFYKGQVGVIVNNQIAVLIPCYNEEQTVCEVVSAFRNHLPAAAVYVYDNNSTDKTAAAAAKSGAVVCHEYRQGKGNVVRSMFRDIEADCYVMVDGDNTYPADYFAENKRRFHNFGNDMVRKVINFLWKPKEPILDVMTGLRAFSPLFVKSFPVLSQGFEVETEMTIHALDNNLLIRSIPVQYRDRPEGSQSKLKTYSDGAKVLLTIFNLFRDYKPLKFFGTLAALLAIVSLILFLPVFSEFLQTGMVPRFPTLIVSVVMMLAAFLSVVCGLILDTNAKNNRKNFEIQMNILKILLNRKHDN